MTPLRKLVKACLDNQPAAQKARYDLYAAQMMGVCYRCTRQIAQARDVLQDGFRCSETCTHGKEKGNWEPGYAESWEARR